jgi:hypothetical protein
MPSGFGATYVVCGRAFWITKCIMVLGYHMASGLSGIIGGARALMSLLTPKVSFLVTGFCIVASL